MLRMSSLCEQPPLMHIESCESRANGYIMFYNVVWNMLFFCIALPLLEADGTCDASGLPKRTEEGVPEIEIADESNGTAKPMAVGRWRRLGLLLWRAISMPPMIATLLGIGVVVVPTVQSSLFNSSGSLRFVGSSLETLSSPMVSCFTMIMAASLVPSDALRKSFTWRTWPVSVFAIVGMLVTRLVIIPCVGFLAWVAVGYILPSGVPNSPPLVSLVILTECSSPAANMPIVFLAKMGKHDVATRLAFIYMFMYPFATLTMTGFSTLAMYLVL